MSRISHKALVAAISKIRDMNLEEKVRLVDEIHLMQPHMFGSFLVQGQLGVPLQKMDFLLDILLVCFQAMKESQLHWPLISEDEQERQLTRYTAIVKFADDLHGTLRDTALVDYMATHPEKLLFAYVHGEIVAWLARVQPEESDKYVMLAAINYVNCIAHVSMSDINSAHPRAGLG